MVFEDASGMAHWKAEVREGITKLKNQENIYPNKMVAEVSNKL